MKARKQLLWVAGSVAVLLSLAAATQAAAARLRLQNPIPERVAAAPVKIRDTIIGGRARIAKAHAAAYGGKFTTPDGTQVTVSESDAFVPDPQALQNWANFFDSLIHGDELSQLSVYIAPQAEMQAICGSPDVDSCYAFDSQTIVLIGGPTPDGVPTEYVAAHEYGHHVAQNRLNDFGVAGKWGPEYWASAEHICQRVGSGTAFPGDEGANYTLNPGEAWAETYRVMNGYGPTLWGITDPSFYPDATVLARARQDVVSPYQGDEYIDRTARFSARGRRWRDYVVPVQNDGTVGLRLRASGSLDADLYVFASRSSKRPIAHATHSGHRERLTENFCGYRHLDIGILRHRGTGRFRLRISLPYFSS